MTACVPTFSLELVPGGSHAVAWGAGASRRHVGVRLPDRLPAEAGAVRTGGPRRSSAEGGTVRPSALTIAADGSYAARLVPGKEAGAWFPERWTLDGPEPYAVPLPGSRPEEPSSGLLPLADGRVLILRRLPGYGAFALLYPAGPGTGELPLGGVACERLTLLPPAPDGSSAYALAVGEWSTTLWLVHGGSWGPERITELPGHCTGGAWLDRTGRMLAVDQTLGGRTKAVTVDLRRGGEVSPLLQITRDSNDRLLLADPDSGLLLVQSDAPGRDQLGWGVLGSTRPLRFPACLRLADAVVRPFATQPGQGLMPENCAVALRIDGAAGSWVGVWRPSGRRLRHLAAPEGWLAGAGLWTAQGELRLPHTTAAVPCGLARVVVPEPSADPGRREAPTPPGRPGARSAPPAQQPPQTGAGPLRSGAGAASRLHLVPAGREPQPGAGRPRGRGPVPLQQAILAARQASREISASRPRLPGRSDVPLPAGAAVPPAAGRHTT